jgi:ABC-2 type transport system permease protein
MTLFLLQLWGELIKMFARKRTYLGFGAFLVVEVVVLLRMESPGGKRWMHRLIERNGLVFDQYFSGLTLAMIMVTLTVFILGTLFLALIGGDIVAKEIEEGAMRMTLCRPVSRLRVLAVKYCGCVIYTFALIIFIGLSALGVATIVRGAGSMLIMLPEENLFALYDFKPGLERYLCALPLFALSLVTVTTFAFNLSCWNSKPAAATITAICICFMDWIFSKASFFESVRPWLMSTHMSAWSDVFRSPIPWQKMVEDYAYLFGLDATFLVVACVIFQSRDFKS